MKQVTAHFEKTKIRETKSGCRIPINYDFWSPLLNYFLKKCNSFRIDCWLDDLKGIESARKYGHEIVHTNDKMRIFEGKINEDIACEIIKKPFDKENKVKWFSLFLKRNEDFILSCEHYGSEFHTGAISDADLKVIESIIPKDFSFYLL